MGYVVYHLHSDYSLLDSCSKFSEYVNLAVEQGMTAIASTEHGKPSGWVGKKMYCDKMGIKFIHGVEIYLTESLNEKVRDNYHTVLLAKNYDGVMELNKLIELSSRPDHMYYTNRLTFDEFLSISPNIIKISACLASPLSKLPHYHEKYMRIAKHYDYLEIQHHNDPAQIEYNRHLYQLSKKINKPLIAGTDTHSASEYKAKCRGILMEYKQQHYEGEDAMDLTWKTYEELVAAYGVQNALPKYAYMQAIENTNRMADSVQDFTLDKTPKYPLLTGSRQSDEQKLHEVVWSKLQDKLKRGVIPPEQKQRFIDDINEQLDVFHKINMAGFMLSMSEIVSWCRDNGIPVGPNRGSVGGSRVAYVTDIIDMNPVTYNTVFSRFCNADRIELGDIDVDCIDSDRPRIFEFIINKFGADKCARVASYGTIADLSFVDDCGGGLAIMWQREHNPDRIDDRGRFNKTKHDFDTKNPYHPKKLAEIKSVYKNDAEKAKKDFPDLFQYFDGMIGTKISQSVHPAGMVISCETLDDHWGVFNKDGERCLFIDMEEAHDVMLVKYDLLILRNIEMISRCCQMAGIPYPRMHEINFHDQEVWEGICKDCDGIFQFESDIAADAIRKFQPHTVEDLSVVNAAIRPSGASYREELLNHHKHSNPTRQIDDLFSDTLGYLVYQEQTIAFLKDICGLSGSQADTIRRAIGKKDHDKINAALPQILDGYCSNSDKPRDEAEQEAKEFLQVIEDASSYSFGYNHSLGYSMISYLCGYFRTHYTEEFIAAYMMTAANDDDITCGKAMAERYGIKIGTPKFRQDNRMFNIDKEHHEISDALSSIKGVGLKDAEALYNLGQNKYETFVDLLVDIENYSGAVNVSVLTSLIKLGYFEEFGGAAKLLDVYNEFSNGKNKYSKTHKQATIDKRLPILREYEMSCVDNDIDWREKISFETQKLGKPFHVLPDKRMCYSVISVDDKYTVQIKLYSVSTGKTGMMRMKKTDYKRKPKLNTGDIIVLTDWAWRQAYQFVNGQSVPIKDKKEPWIKAYELVYEVNKK